MAPTDSPPPAAAQGPAADLPQVPAWQVLEQPEGFWRGRTVLIGATAPDLGDQQETPFGPQSGAQVQLAALASVLHGQGIEVDHAVAMVRERDELAHPEFYADPDRVLKFEELSSIDANVHGIYRWLDKRAESGA